jgi:hypothetical protein
MIVPMRRVRSPSAPRSAARAELRGERAGILGATGATPLAPLVRAHRVPDRWSFIYVMERMEQAFRTLGRLPMATRPRGYVNSMPIYFEESRKMQERRHADTSAVLRDLAQKLDAHAAAVDTIRPTVAALALSRSRLTAWASIGLAAVIVLGWVVQSGIKWLVSTALSHLH